MRIRFSEISPSGSRYVLRALDGIEAQDGFAVKEPVVAQCTLKRKGDAKVEMLGQLQATLALPCDRCLEDYELSLDTRFQLVFEKAGDESWQLKDMECKGDDVDTVFLDEPVVDVDDVFRQQIHLALPVKRLCVELCKGICSRCGANLNFGKCHCLVESKESPFSILDNLK